MATHSKRVSEIVINAIQPHNIARACNAPTRTSRTTHVDRPAKADNREWLDPKEITHFARVGFCVGKGNFPLPGGGAV